jgi:transposase-like protein
MKKIAPSHRLREELRSFSFLQEAGDAGEGAHGLSELVRLATTLITQQGLEAEQRDFIGRERYERGARRGYRSGYKPGRMDTAQGRIAVALPQVRGAETTYHSRLFDFLLKSRR